MMKKNNQGLPREELMRRVEIIRDGGYQVIILGEPNLNGRFGTIWKGSSRDFGYVMIDGKVKLRDYKDGDVSQISDLSKYCREHNIETLEIFHGKDLANCVEAGATSDELDSATRLADAAKAVRKLNSGDAE